MPSIVKRHCPIGHFSWTLIPGILPWRAASMSTLTKYLLFQIPGWILAIVIVAALRVWLEIPLWVALGLVILWVFKDLAMYPFLRTAYESDVKTGVGQLVGARGVAHGELAPRGYVRVRGELWRAEARGESQPISPGSPIRVEGAEGMTLLVKADPANRPT